MKAATVISTKEFDKNVAGLLTADEVADLEFSIAVNPAAHPVIPGTKGIRKARWGKQGSGKRGGIRVIYLYAIIAEEVFLLTAYSKNQQENLTNDQKKAIRRLVDQGL